MFIFSLAPPLYAFRPGFLSTKKIIAGDIFQRRNFQGCRQPISSRLQPLKLRIHHDAFVCDGIPKEKLYEFSTVNTCRRAKKEWSSKFQRPWPTINHKAYVASTCTHTGCLWMLEAPWGPAGRRRAAGAAPNYPEIIPIIQVVRAVCRIIQVQRGRDDISGQPGCAAPAQNHSWCILTLSSFWFQIFRTFCLVSPLVTCSTQLKATGSQN